MFLHVGCSQSDSDTVSALLSLCSTSCKLRTPTPTIIHHTPHTPHKRTFAQEHEIPTGTTEREWEEEHRQMHFLKPRRMSFESDVTSRRSSIASTTHTPPSDTDSCSSRSSPATSEDMYTTDDEPFQRMESSHKRFGHFLAVPGQPVVATPYMAKVVYDRPVVATLSPRPLPAWTRASNGAVTAIVHAAKPSAPPTHLFAVHPTPLAKAKEYVKVKAEDHVERVEVAVPSFVPTTDVTSVVPVEASTTTFTALPAAIRARYSRSLCCRHVVLAYSIYQSQQRAPPSAQADPLAPAMKLRIRLHEQSMQHQMDKQPSMIDVAPLVHSYHSSVTSTATVQSFVPLVKQYSPPAQLPVLLSPAEQFRLLQQLHASTPSPTTLTPSSSAIHPSPVVTNVAKPALSQIARPAMVHVAKAVVVPPPSNSMSTGIPLKMERRNSLPSQLGTTVTASAIPIGAASRRMSASNIHAPLPPIHPHPSHTPLYAPSSHGYTTFPSTINLSLHTTSGTNASSSPVNHPVGSSAGGFHPHAPAYASHGLAFQDHPPFHSYTRPFSMHAHEQPMIYSVITHTPA